MSSSDTQWLFPTPVITAFPADGKNWNRSLKKAIKERRREHKGLKRSNLGGWHSSDDMEKWGGEEASALAKFVFGKCAENTIDTEQFGAERRYSWHMQMWANVSPAGAMNEFHAHPGAIWSAVYYVDAGDDVEGGRLKLQDPRYPAVCLTNPALRFRERTQEPHHPVHYITPEAGKAVIFPAWLMHAVEPHNGKRARISIAMNIVAHFVPRHMRRWQSQQPSPQSDLIGTRTS